jgi:two-component system phosphate regulon response regulator PhoB
MTQTVLRRVLIVDDESSIRDMVAITLEMAGFEVVQAIDASAALESLRVQKPVSPIDA